MHYIEGSKYVNTGVRIPSLKDQKENWINAAAVIIRVLKMMDDD